MKKEAGAGWVAQIQSRRPLVHCITNYVTANDVANMILAVGGAPVMADFAGEMEEITGASDALVLNLGTLNPQRLEAVLAAGRCAVTKKLPVVLDPVGVGASQFRLQAALEVLNQVSCTVIRGNAGEIGTLVRELKREAGACKERVKQEALPLARGVDVGAGAEAKTCSARFRQAAFLACQTGAVVAVTGARDLVTDGERAAVVSNGDPLMSQITGSGCMLDGVIAAFLALGRDPFETAVTAVAAFGVCGEMAAATHKTEPGVPAMGTGTFRLRLLDAASRLTDCDLAGLARVQCDQGGIGE